MDLEKAIREGSRMKFIPPANLQFCVRKLRAIDELFGTVSEIELSVSAVDGLFGLLDDIGQEIRDMAEEQIGKQIGKAPEQPAKNDPGA